MSSLPEIKNLSTLLQKHFNRDIKILKQSSKLLTAPGENYGSVMLALDLTIEETNSNQQELNLVAKLLPANEMLCELFNVQVTYKTELSIYIDLVPALALLEDEYGIKEGRASELFAKCYGGRQNLKTEVDPVDQDAVILFENLKTLGYEMGDRLIGFDYDHAVFVLKNLARYHAVPIALKLLKPEIYNKFALSTLTSKQPNVEFSNDNVEKLASQMRNIMMNRKEFLPQIEKTVDRIKYHCQGRFDRYKDPKELFATVGHTDFWMNNMMVLKGKDGKPEKLKMVDFQLPISDSATNDMLFFIYSSVMPSVLYENVDNFIKIYFDAFIECLKQFKVNTEPFSWELYNKEIKRGALDEITHILFMYKVILMQRGVISDMAEYKDDDFFDLGNITSDCKDRILKTFVDFVEHGWIQ